MTLTIPLAAITLMLWIIWSDSVRRGRTAPLMYYIRSGIYALASIVLVVNLVRLYTTMQPFTRTLTIVAFLVGLAGTWYFFRRGEAQRVSRKTPVVDEPQHG